MKEIFTLLFTTAMLTSAFAQYGQKDQRDYNNGKDVVVNNGKNKFDKDDYRFNDRDHFTARERDFQIAQINREYDYKIQSVRNKFFLSRYQKMSQISFLQDQRDNEIRMVYAKFNGRRKQYDDDDHGSRRY